MIAAMANHRIIGADNDMPWHLPADLKHFKAITMGKPVLMGRKTYESIGKALPGRPNIVITSNESYSLDDATVVHSIEAAMQKAAAFDEVMIIGGGSIYESMLSQAQRLYLTFIDLTVDGDTKFPDYEANANWQELSRETHQKDDKNPYDYTFVTLERA
ncbi:type 3 dihydrofolate reductase [Brumicola nitratireducens]|uniref:Dihydrofolate reductase n=1 Tax=Glaciecola nitratireducens (strain JCM 12485 / KCTC 12276 / FR1064) TaxID=1085623 RepID=G4QMT8_GLANF|nr:type 3 dihydrofolate reductase [Glaciecola nitratireducens]AEP31021.1 dihydrofolate reductase type I, trimethoprim resistance [Glaciecola nitratireducens FR1064]